MTALQVRCGVAGYCKAMQGSYVLDMEKCGKFNLKWHCMALQFDEDETNQSMAKHGASKTFHAFVTPQL